MRRIRMPAAIGFAAALLVSCATGPNEIDPVLTRVYGTKDGKYMSLPADVRIEAVLETPRVPASAKEGDRVVAHVTGPVIVSSQIMIPVGAKVHGVVGSAAPKKITVAFDRMDIGRRSVGISGEASVTAGPGDSAPGARRTPITVRITKPFSVPMPYRRPAMEAAPFVPGQLKPLPMQMQRAPMAAPRGHGDYYQDRGSYQR